GATDIEQNEPRVTAGQRFVDIPAIGLEPEAPLEMRQGIAARRRRNRGDIVRHEPSPGSLGAACCSGRQVTIGKNAIYDRNHAEGAWSPESTGRGPAA